MFCRMSQLEEQREEWEERRSALRQVHATVTTAVSNRHQTPLTQLFSVDF